MTLAVEDFNFLCALIKERSGINLGEDKSYLLDSRLLPIARKMELENLTELVAKIRLSKDEEIMKEIIEAMTTNETSFFRDITPFDNFRDHVIPHVLETNTDKNIRIWCAAASSGQESYSLAMTILEQKAKFDGYNIEIIGTDIDTAILKKAEEGIYTQFEVQRGLPVMMLMKYFTQQESYGEKWVLNQEVKDIVKFKKFNLLEEYYDSMGKFDVIFCRNVLIYFDIETKKTILNNLERCMKKDSVLFLGSAETVNDLDTDLGKFNDVKGVLARNK